VSVGSGRARPSWLTVRAPTGERVEEVARVLRHRGLRTVCREARCPNVGECWGAGTATVLILGDVCTRKCTFCSVTPGVPLPPDPAEPDRVAAAAAELGWRHVVVTSVTRDDLPDGGAAQFARVIGAIRRRAPGAAVEVLVPDFEGREDALRMVLAAEPDILAHNVETVPRLYARVRPGADYRRSIAIFRRARAVSPKVALKSGIMLGLGEGRDEVEAVLADLAAAGCRSITMGQYLPPSRNHLPVTAYVDLETFEELASKARRMGFVHVLSGPLVRSSYKAAEVGA
jgi:lipoyl synthase